MQKYGNRFGQEVGNSFVQFVTFIYIFFFVKSVIDGGYFVGVRK